MAECKVTPEFEIFDAGMIYNVLYYIKKGLITHRPHFQFVLGAPGGMTAEVKNMMFLLDVCKDNLGSNFTWSALGVGRVICQSFMQHLQWAETCALVWKTTSSTAKVSLQSQM